MSLPVEYSPSFEADLWLQLAWYAERSGVGLAERFATAVELSAQEIVRTPGLGRRPFPKDPDLAEFQSFRVQSPFDSHRIFYRITAASLVLERLVHGARDLPRRLKEPPGSD